MDEDEDEDEDSSNRTKNPSEVDRGARLESWMATIPAARFATIDFITTTIYIDVNLAIRTGRSLEKKLARTGQV